MSGLPLSNEKHVYDNILSALCRTPLVRLERVAESVRLRPTLSWRILNPGKSIKDRVGLNIAEGAEKRGELKLGGTVVEATSGNIGVELAISSTFSPIVFDSYLTATARDAMENVNRLDDFTARCATQWTY